MDTMYEKTTAGGTGSAGQQMADKAKEQARTIKEEAMRKGRDLFTEYKSDAAKIGADFADVLETAAKELNEKQRKTSADYIRSASGEIRRFSAELDNRAVEDITDEIRTFARRQPAVLFGGALIAGFALTRFFKGTGQEVMSGTSMSTPPASRTQSSLMPAETASIPG